MYKVGSQSVPRPKYFSSCEDGTTGQTVLYISFCIGESWPGGMNDWAPDPTAGMMLRAVLNDEGQLEVMQARQFPECRQMEGVATSDDCSTVAVICRVAPESTMVVDADARDDQTALEDKDQLWLYEWTDGQWSQTESEPYRVIVHKGVPGTARAQLRYGQAEDAYSISSGVKTGGLGNHDNHALVVVDVQRDGSSSVFQKVSD